MSGIQSTVLVVVGACIGGAAGAGVTLLLAPESKQVALAKDEATVSKKAPKARRPTDDVTRLERRLDSLERRLSLLTFAQAHSKPTKPAADVAGDDAPAEPPKVVDDPVFEAAVRDVVDRIDFEKETQRDVERTERRQASTKRWVESISNELKLTQEQQEKIAGVVAGYYEKLRELRDADAPDRPLLRSEWRERMRAARAEAEEGLKAVLDTDQRSKYEQLDEAEQFVGFWPRRGRRR